MSKKIYLTEEGKIKIKKQEDITREQIALSLMNVGYEEAADYVMNLKL